MRKTGRRPRTKREMIAYLAGHPRYDTMNSWNAATSYARNVKLHKLEIPTEIRDRCYDLLQVAEAFGEVYCLFNDFAERHDWRHRIAFNGRSGGYCVLYQGERKPSGYKSRCTVCGQLNYQDVPEGQKERCGRCGRQERVQIASTHMQVSTFPGRGLDEDQDFDSWDTDTLKDRVDLVWDFDRTVEAAVQAFIDFARTHVVEDETVYVPKTVKVAREAA